MDIHRHIGFQGAVSIWFRQKSPEFAPGGCQFVHVATESCCNAMGKQGTCTGESKRWPISCKHLHLHSRARRWWHLVLTLKHHCAQWCPVVRIYQNLIYIYIWSSPPWFPPPPKGGIRNTYTAMYWYNYMFVLIYVCMPVCLSVCLSVGM